MELYADDQQMAAHSIGQEYKKILRGKIKHIYRAWNLYLKNYRRKINIKQGVKLSGSQIPWWQEGRLLTTGTSFILKQTGNWNVLQCQVRALQKGSCSGWRSFGSHWVPLQCSFIRFFSDPFTDVGQEKDICSQTQCFLHSDH